MGLFTTIIFPAITAPPAFAQDLTAFRAQHKRPPLTISATLTGIAYEPASMAGRSRIDD